MNRIFGHRLAEPVLSITICALVSLPALCLGAASPDLRIASALAAFAVAWGVAVRGSVRSTRFPVPAEAIVMAVAAAFTVLQSLPVGPVVAGWLGGTSADRIDQVVTATGIASPWRTLSADPGSTLVEGIRLWAGALMLATFTAISVRRRRRRTILMAVAMMGALQGLAGLATGLFGMDIRTAFTDNPLASQPGFHGTFLNDNHTAGAFNLAAFAFLGLALDTPSPFRFAFYAGAVWMAWGTFIVGSGGASLVLVLTGAMYLAWSTWLCPDPSRSRQPKSIRVLLAVGLVAALVLAFVAVDQWVIRYGQESQLARSVDGKTRIWGPALELALEHPFAGVGRGAFPVAVTAVNNVHPSMTYDYVENAPLQALADWGFPAGILLLAITIFLGIRLLLAASDRKPLLAAMFGVVAVALQNLGDFSLEMPGIALPVLAIVGAAITHRRRVASQEGRPRHTIRAPVALGIASASLALAVPLAWAGSQSLDRSRSTLQGVYNRVRSGEPIPADVAESTLSSAVKLHPHDAFMFDLGSRIAFTQERMDRAGVLADAALLLFPRSVSAGLVRIEVDRALGRPEESTHRLATLLDVRPDAETTVFDFLENARWPDADVAASLHGDSGTLDRYVDALVRARRLPQAIRVLKARIAQEPDDRASMFKASKLLLNVGDVAAADETAVRLLALFPETQDGWLLLARIARFRDQNLEALALFREAASRAPDSTEADLGILRSLLMLGRGEEFADMAHRLEARIGRDIYTRSELLQMMATRESRLGRYATALDRLEQAERLVPWDPMIPLARARVRLASGDVPGARRELHRCLALDPTHPEARQALESLDNVNPAKLPDEAP